MSGLASPEPSRLARRLDLRDAVVIGLGGMIGAGVFTAIGPAARAAGPALLVGLAIAAAVAWCNATSSAQLAAVHPESGGAYVWGRARLGHAWGFLAGWGFVWGKIASCTAMALTFGAHALPSHPHIAAALAALTLTAVNLAGVTKTVAATSAILLVVLVTLGVAVIAMLAGGTVDPSRLADLPRDLGAFDVLQSAGFLFFAFAGYARIATLGEEVKDPRTTIPRAIPRALMIALVIYAVVALAALLAADTGLLARSDAPLAVAIEHGRLAPAAWVVRLGAAVACLGVLLSLLAGISRTVFAMATTGDLPRPLSFVASSTRVPWLAQVAAGGFVTLFALAADVRTSIGFSAFTVLGYYAVANAAAWTLPASERRWSRVYAAAGLAGCVLLAFSLPLEASGSGIAVFAVAGIILLLRRIPPL